VLTDARKIYRTLLGVLLSLGKHPEWDSLELEAHNRMIAIVKKVTDR
jgi:hypothetical protein